MKLLRALETIDGCITKGRLYSELREYTGNQGCVIIVDDNGDESTLFKERFKEVIIKDIAEAFGMWYYGDDGYDESTGNYYHIFKFYNSNKEIKVGRWMSKEEAWEEASDEFLKPLEKILFDNL